MLVNDHFLTSHAYLRDSAVRVRACHLAVAGKDPRGPVVSALKQASLDAGEIQLVEAQGTTPSSVRELRLASNGAISEEDAVSASELPPLAGFGTTSLTGLCGIGKYTTKMNQYDALLTRSAHSLATSRLGPRVEARPSQFSAVHHDSKRIDCDSDFLPLGWSPSPSLRRREESARWSRKTWTQSCRGRQRSRLEIGRREVQGGRQDSARWR